MKQTHGVTQNAELIHLLEWRWILPAHYVALANTRASKKQHVSQMFGPARYQVKGKPVANSTCTILAQCKLLDSDNRISASRSMGSTSSNGCAVILCHTRDSAHPCACIIFTMWRILRRSPTTSALLTGPRRLIRPS